MKFSAAVMLSLTALSLVGCASGADPSSQAIAACQKAVAATYDSPDGITWGASNAVAGADGFAVTSVLTYEEVDSDVTCDVASESGTMTVSG